jgi:Flp pilus assembly protein TadD
MILLMQNRPQEALVELNQAVSLEPHNWEALNNRAIALSRLGRYYEALQDVEHAMRLFPDNPALPKNREIILKKLQ